MSVVGGLYKDAQALASNYLPAAVGFANFILLARLLPSEAFGEWMIFISLLGVLDSIRHAPIQSSLVNMAEAASPRGAFAYYQAGLYFFVAASLVMAVVVWLAPHTSLAEQNVHLHYFFRLFPAFICLSIPAYFGQMFFMNRRRFARLMYLRLASSFPFSLYLVVCWYNAASLDYLSEAFLLAHALGSLLAWRMGVLRRPKGQGFHWVKLRELLMVGRYMVLNRGFNVSRKNTDILLVGWLMGPVAAGFYAIPLKVVEMAEMALRAFQSNYYPQLVAEVQGRKMFGTSTYLSYLQKMWAFGLAAAFGIYILSAWLLQLFTGQAPTAELVAIMEAMAFMVPILAWFQLEVSRLLAQERFRFLSVLLLVLVSAHVATTTSLILLAMPMYALALGLAAVLLAGALAMRLSVVRPKNLRIRN